MSYAGHAMSSCSLPKTCNQCRQPSILDPELGIEVALLYMRLLSGGFVENVTAVFCGIWWL